MAADAGSLVNSALAEAAPASVIIHPDQPTDTELAARVAHGEVAALELLFQRHAQALQRFVMRSIPNIQNAEDVVQDVFVKIAECAGSFRGTSSFRTWMFTLALNLVRSQRRRSAVETHATERLQMDARHALPSAQRNDPAAGAEQRELLAKVDRAIAGLAEPERETFLLYWFGELSYAEIREATGVSISAAKVRVHRAMARLSRVLAG